MNVVARKKESSPGRGATVEWYADGLCKHMMEDGLRQYRQPITIFVDAAGIGGALVTMAGFNFFSPSQRPRPPARSSPG